MQTLIDCLFQPTYMVTTLFAFGWLYYVHRRSTNTLVEWIKINQRRHDRLLDFAIRENVERIRLEKELFPDRYPATEEGEENHEEDRRDQRSE